MGPYTIKIARLLGIGCMSAREAVASHTVSVCGLENGRHELHDDVVPGSGGSCSWVGQHLKGITAIPNGECSN